MLVKQERLESSQVSYTHCANLSNKQNQEYKKFFKNLNNFNKSAWNLQKLFQQQPPNSNKNQNNSKPHQNNS